MFELYSKLAKFERNVVIGSIKTNGSKGTSVLLGATIDLKKKKTSLTK